MAKEQIGNLPQEGKEKDIPGSTMRQISDDPDNHAAKGVCKIVFNGSGTGFLGKFSLGNREVCGLFTNNHVLNESDLQLGTQFTLDFQNPDGTSITRMTLPREGTSGHQSFFTCPILDATFIEFDQTIINDLEGYAVEYLPLIDEHDDIKMEEQLTVIGHPCYNYDGTKHFASGELHKFHGFNLLHKASTNRGSSGSPVITTDGKVVGLHKAASSGDCNVAVSIVAVRQAIEAKKVTTSKLNYDAELESLGLIERFTHCKPLIVYSFMPDSKPSKEKWFVLSGYGWYWTSTNPCKVAQTMMFHLLNWMPLKDAQFFPDQDGKDICELASKLSEFVNQ